MMSVIALESNTGADRIYRSVGFIHGMSSYNGIYDPAGGGGGQRFNDRRATVEDDGGDSCSSSSIGRNSDDLSDGGDGDSSDGEVQSSVRGGALNNLNALEEVLPIKHGISTFYSGKSKSYTSLADAETCSSVREIAKPEDAYTRKRKNLLAHSIFSDKNHNPLSRSSSSSSGGISKRLASSSRSTLALGFTMASSVSSNNNGCSVSKSSSPCIALPPLPPLPPHGRRVPNNEPSSSPPRRSPGRSLSLSDLQHAKAPTPPATDSVMNNKDKEGKC